jgi:tetratricopeptide (TPR) repeat protein
LNAFAQQLLGVAKGYLGPATQTFLSAEFHALGVNANTIGPEQLEALVARVRMKAARAMGDERAAELASALAACGVVQKAADGGHRLASDAAAKLLAAGRARPAEVAYRALVDKHGDIEAYCGLARAQAAQQDVGAALTTLREAAARFAQGGDRATAVALLLEAVAIAPSDLAAHRRLAAALANQGDLPSAIREYARFVDMALAQQDTRRAWLELTYGRETLGDLPGLRAIVDRLVAASGGSAGPAPRIGEVPPIIARSELAPRPPAAKTHVPSPIAMSRPTALTHKSEPSALRPEPPALRPEPAAVRTEPPALRPEPPALRPEPPALRPEPAALRTEPAKTVATAAAAAAAAAEAKSHPLGARMHAPEQTTRPSASQTTVVLKGASTVTHATDLGGPIDLLARAGFASNGHTPQPVAAPARAPRAPRPPLDMESQIKALVPKGNDLDAANTAATKATLLIGMRDKRANEATLDAARRLLTLGKLQSASDLLLDYIAHGFTDREAQRLLIEIDCAIGRRDTAKEKCHLLSHAYRLDGRNDVAEDVERIARIL